MEFVDRRTAPVGGKSWFVYSLVDSRDTDTVRYIGITNAPRRRLSHHYSPALDGHTRKARWISKVLREGGQVLMGFFECGLSQAEAKLVEISLISTHKSRSLTNLTLGGDGTAGWEPSDEVKEKIAATRRGKPLSVETRAKLSCVNMGRTSPNKGKVLSKVWRGNIGNGVRRSLEDPSVREKISAAGVARYLSKTERSRAATLSHLAGPGADNKTGYKGVSFCNRTKKWVAQIKDAPKRRMIGRFPTPELAAHAYDRAAFKAWCGDCYLNFPVSMTASQENTINERL